MAMFRALPRVYDEICPALPGPETQDSTPDSVKLLHIADRSKSHSGGTQTWPLAGRICPALPGPETQDSLPSAMVKTKKIGHWKCDNDASGESKRSGETVLA